MNPYRIIYTLIWPILPIALVLLIIASGIFFPLGETYGVLWFLHTFVAWGLLAVLGYYLLAITIISWTFGPSPLDWLENRARDWDQRKKQQESRKPH